MMVYDYVSNEYPNIGKMLETMPKNLASMAIYCLAMLDEVKIQNIEEMLPELSSGIEDKNEGAVRLLLLTFDIPNNVIDEIIEALPGFATEEPELEQTG